MQSQLTTAASDVTTEPSGALAPQVQPADQQAAANTAAALLVQQRLADKSAEPTIQLPDFDKRQQAKDAQAADVASITPAYGIAPRRYRTVLEVPTNKTEARFAAAVPLVTAFVNRQLAASGSKIHITEAEVAVNFLAEGGILLTGADQGDGVSGFQSAGIDTLVDRYAQVKHLLPPDLTSMIDNQQNFETNTNEKGQQVHSLTNLSIEQAMYGNAALFANARGILVKDLATHGRTWDSLTPREQFYWTTVYYNAGEGTGRAQLAQLGVAYADKPLSTAEVASAKSSSTHYNGEWRTATWQLVSRGSTSVSSGITPTPERTLTVSAAEAEFAQVYSSVVVPVAHGTAPWKTLQRGADERSFITAAFQALGTNLSPQLMQYGAVLDSLGIASDPIASLSAALQHDVAAVYAAKGRTVPSWGDMTLPQISNELDSIDTLSSPTDPLASSKQSLAQVRSAIQQAMEQSQVAAMSPDEIATAIQPLRDRLTKIVAGSAPLGDGLDAAIDQFQRLAQSNPQQADQPLLSDASLLANVLQQLPVLAQQLGAQLPATLSGLGLPTGPLTDLTTQQLATLAKSLTGSANAPDTAQNLTSYLGMITAPTAQ